MAVMPFSTQGKDGKYTHYKGVTTVERRPYHNIIFRPRYEPKEFSIWTCGRDNPFESPTKEIKYRYVPTFEIEFDGVCPLQAVSIGKNGVREYAIININNGDDLKMDVYCNGKSVTTNGAYLCQLPNGLIAGVHAYENVIFEASEGCSDLVESSFRSYRLNVSKGFCTYTFYGKTSKKFFVLTTKGYKKYD